MNELQSLLERSAARHSHLCPRQVLGVRMGLYAGRLLGISLPQDKKRLLTIVETDGCFADGIDVATGCTVGHRTLRVEDYGKTAAVFIDTLSRRSMRLSPSPDVRHQAYRYALDCKRRYFAQLEGYQRMPDESLFELQEIELALSIEAIVSRAGVRVNCDVCGEEIINEREIYRDGLVLCRGCAGPSYYRPALRARRALIGEAIPAMAPSLEIAG